jgi:hypothetical protein
MGAALLCSISFTIAGALLSVNEINVTKLFCPKVVKGESTWIVKSRGGNDTSRPAYPDVSFPPLLFTYYLHRAYPKTQFWLWIEVVPDRFSDKLIMTEARNVQSAG